MSENIYHRYLELPFEIAPPACVGVEEAIVKHYVLDHLPYPEIDALFAKHGLICCRKECFYTPPHGKVPIHTDHASYTHHVKINVSWGPAEGVLQWWQSDVVEERIIAGATANTSAYHRALWAAEKDCTLLHQANTNRPSLVNVGILHGTHNPTPHGRWTLCFAPWDPKKNGPVHWLDALALFKDLVVERNLSMVLRHLPSRI